MKINDHTAKNTIINQSLNSRTNIIEMLDSWCNLSEEEAEEQKETLQYLMKALEITE